MKPFKQYRKLKLIGVRKNTGQFSIPKSLLNKNIENTFYSLEIHHRFNNYPLKFVFYKINHQYNSSFIIQPSFVSGQLNLTIPSKILKQITLQSHRLFSLEVTPLEFRFIELSVEEVQELEQKEKSPKRPITKKQLSEFHDPEDTYFKKKIKEIENVKVRKN